MYCVNQSTNAESISNINGIKRTHQEIILDHAKNPEIRESVLVIIMMAKLINFYVYVRFIYLN